MIQLSDSQNPESEQELFNASFKVEKSEEKLKIFDHFDVRKTGVQWLAKF